MATVDDLNAAAQAVSDAVTALIAKAQADATAAVVPEFQSAVDTLNATQAAIQAYLNPPA